MDILKEYPLIDEHGKRYREFGRGCREYAPVIVTSAGEVPMGTVIYKKMQEEPPAQRKIAHFRAAYTRNAKRIAAFTKAASASREQRRRASAALSPRIWLAAIPAPCMRMGAAPSFAAERKRKNERI